MDTFAFRIFSDSHITAPAYDDDQEGMHFFSRIQKKQRAPEGTLCRKDAFCEKLPAAYFCAAMPCWASENSSTSTEMLCLIGFHWHFFTRATSAMGTYVSMKNGKVNM